MLHSSGRTIEDLYKSGQLQDFLIVQGESGSKKFRSALRGVKFVVEVLGMQQRSKVVGVYKISGIDNITEANPTLAVFNTHSDTTYPRLRETRRVRYVH